MRVFARKGCQSCRFLDFRRLEIFVGEELFGGDTGSVRGCVAARASVFTVFWGNDYLGDMATTIHHRIVSIDLLRGAVMLIMAIDHCRDHLLRGHPDPTDLGVTTPLLFFTRWITHFCTPVFVFLSGISAWLAGARRTEGQLSALLIKRGFWLIAVEALLISPGLSLDPLYHMVVLQVIWAIGGSMFLLGLLIRLRVSRVAIGVTGAVIVVGHNI